MHEIYELKELLMKELEEYGRKGDLSAGSLDIVDKLAHATKNLCKIIESAEDEYSEAGGSYEGGSMAGGNSYSRRGSYAGGGSSRNSYARRRDSRGRYSGENRRYSRGDQMEEMIESIRGMMQELPQDVQREAQKFVQKLEEQMQ